MDVLSHVLGIPKISGGGGGVAPEITTTSLPDATVGTAYSQTITATGTPAPTFSVTAGSLPDGLSLNANSGAITGTPTTIQNASFTITATNAFGTNDQAYSFVVRGAEKIVNGSMEAAGTWANQGTPTTSERSTEQAQGGSWSWKVISDANFEGIRQAITVAQGTSYRVDYWVFIVTGSVASAIATVNGATISTTGQWVHVQEDLVAGSSGSQSLFLWSRTAASTFYIDNVSVKENPS